MKKIVFIAFLFSYTIASAQFTESLSSDRPGQALSSNVVGKNVFQIQTGIDFFESTSNFYPSSYFRYGFSERFEINSGIILSGDKFASNLESFTIGTRFRLNNLESKSQSSLQLSYDLDSDVKNTQFMYLFSSSISDKFAYALNFGINLNDKLSFDNGVYVFNLSYAINNKIGVFAETFGTFLDGNTQFNIDSGFYYLVNSNFQLDVLVGENNGFFIGTGFTLRIPPKSN